jgi:hypothetical protein
LFVVAGLLEFGTDGDDFLAAQHLQLQVGQV